jgi:putative ATPase
LRLSGGDGRAIKIFELVVNASNEDEILITNDLVFLSAKYGFMIKQVSRLRHSFGFYKIDSSDPNGAVY